MSRTLRFDREIYAGEAVDEAVKIYSPYAEFELSESPSSWEVTLKAKSEARERKIARELGNYALGLTLRKRGQR